jgi:hypothetical protein
MPVCIDNAISTINNIGHVETKTETTRTTMTAVLNDLGDKIETQ